MERNLHDEIGVNGNQIFAVVPEAEQRTIEIEVKGNNEIEVKNLDGNDVRSLEIIAPLEA
jgi:hypothetical protein